MLPYQPNLNKGAVKNSLGTVLVPISCMEYIYPNLKSKFECKYKYNCTMTYIEELNQISKYFNIRSCDQFSKKNIGTMFQRVIYAPKPQN